jgi:hypothetical protein
VGTVDLGDAAPSLDEEGEVHLPQIQWAAWQARPSEWRCTYGPLVVVEVGGRRASEVRSRTKSDELADMSTDAQSFLAIEGRHAFITGGAGGVGSAAAKEFLGMEQIKQL